MRNRKLFSVPAEALAALMTSGKGFRFESVPPDATFLMAGWNPRAQTIDMLFEHESFSVFDIGDPESTQVLHAVSADVEDAIAEQLDDLREAA
jgi:hypothetical protein